ncbi:hypothetical protein DVS28_b0251 (plasmid) [Euzebya pacifica]|uniref:Uncharacterized protein n=1 Tax=Euzebya pacifica TaxID=1608957 RepID=A0A346Y6C4_9ACTN|nr:hypothetical protein [Euzebya pacifica]AXV10021.1 hypothetical protein DVS28_b0251 [Euzebya pacifica]
MSTDNYRAAHRLIRDHGFVVTGTSRRETATLDLPDGNRATIISDVVKGRLTSCAISGQGCVALSILTDRLDRTKESQ